MIIPRDRVLITPFYLFDRRLPFLIVAGFILQGCFAGGGMYGQNPAYLNERFPTEVRATASAFSYHQSARSGRAGAAGPDLFRDDCDSGSRSRC